MADPNVVPLTDEELQALAPQFQKDPALMNKLTSDERRRLQSRPLPPPPEAPAPTSGSPLTDVPKDLAIGVGKGIAGTVTAPTVVAPLINRMAASAYGRPPIDTTPSDQGLRTLTDASNTTQAIGKGAETVAELALPMKLAADAVPTVAKAGAKFQSVMAAAHDIPVNVNAPGEVALRIHQLAERGGSMPMAVRKFLGRVTQPDGAPFTYAEARDFASNISRLSANEYNRLTPVVAREVATLRVTLNQAVADAAKQAGKLDEYRAAMKEYAQAMKIKDAISSVVEGAKRSVPYATAAGAGYWLTSHLRRMLGGE